MEETSVVLENIFSHYCFDSKCFFRGFTASVWKTFLVRFFDLRERLIEGLIDVFDIFKIFFFFFFEEKIDFSIENFKKKRIYFKINN